MAVCSNARKGYCLVEFGHFCTSKSPRALTCFKQMEETGATPDAITFMALLSACAQLGLVNEGKNFFSSMIEEYEITPIMEHYACLVNLLRKGRNDR